MQSASPSAQCAGRIATTRRTDLFIGFYSPESLTSFDDLLHRPHLDAVSTQSVGEQRAPLRGMTVARESSKEGHDGHVCEVREAELGRVAAGDVLCARHPLWVSIVTWDGAVRYGLMGEKLELKAIGGKWLHVLLPANYIECDLWKDSLVALSNGHKEKANTDALYGRFSSEAVIAQCAAATTCATMFAAMRADRQHASAVLQAWKTA